jgi:hypothetical protein
MVEKSNYLWLVVKDYGIIQMDIFGTYLRGFQIGTPLYFRAEDRILWVIDSQNILFKLSFEEGMKEVVRFSSEEHILYWDGIKKAFTVEEGLKIKCIAD